MAHAGSRTKGNQARVGARRPPRPAFTGELRSAPAGAQPSPVGLVVSELEAGTQVAHWYFEHRHQSGDSTYSSGSEYASPLQSVIAPQTAPPAAIKPMKSTAGARPLVMQAQTSTQASTDLGEDENDLNAQIKVCAHNGDIATAEELLRKIEEGEGCELSVDTYNAVIHTCTQCGDIERVENYMRRMKENGFEPNLVTFNSVINACATRGDAPRAEKWLLTMVSNGIQPNHVTYGTVCKVFARQGGVKQIEGIMWLLENNGIPLNEYFFASLISACGAANPPDPLRAERALADLVQRGLRPQSVKRAIARVVGNRRTAYLFEGLGRMAGEGVSGEASSPQPGGGAERAASGGTRSAAAFPARSGAGFAAGLSGSPAAGGKGPQQNPRRRPKTGWPAAPEQRAPAPRAPAQRAPAQRAPAQKARPAAGLPAGAAGTFPLADNKARRGPLAPGFAPQPLLSLGAVPPGAHGRWAATASSSQVAPQAPAFARPPQAAWRSEASAAYVPGAVLLHAAVSPHASVGSEPDSRLMHYGL